MKEFVCLFVIIYFHSNTLVQVHEINILSAKEPWTEGVLEVTEGISCLYDPGCVVDRGGERKVIELEDRIG